MKYCMVIHLQITEMMNRRKSIAACALAAEIDLGESNEKVMEQMSEEEIAKLRDAFYLYDKDNSGSINTKVSGNFDLYLQHSRYF